MLFNGQSDNTNAVVWSVRQRKAFNNMQPYRVNNCVERAVTKAKNSFAEL